MALSFCSFHVRVLFPFFLTFINLFSFSESAPPLRNETDRLALLAFKNGIYQDSNGVLSSWNNSLHFCMWAGVTCSRRHPQRVIQLNLTQQNLVGHLSAYIGNLSFLRIIEVSNNSLQGQIPQEIGRLRRLRYFNLRGNSLGGEIPKNLTQCSELGVVELYANRLVGRIPAEIEFLPKLYYLGLGNNNFTGNIPLSFGNLSSLRYLYLSYNSLEGIVPDDLGRLVNLNSLSLDVNNLTGMIPSSLYNLTSISVLSFGANRLHGSLPPELGLSLPNLQGLYVGDNQFTGALPFSIGNASKLVGLDFSWNNFSGSVPLNVGMLQSLNRFKVGENQLGGEDDDLGFITSLANCSGLEILTLGRNHFRGLLPNSISNLSTQLTQLWLGENYIFGNIPTGIDNLASLTLLSMQNNLLTGTISSNLGKLQNLEVVYFQQNKFSGQIPTSLGNLTNLGTLLLHGNDLLGSIPSSLGNCQRLNILSLSNNHLNGTIPREVLGIPTLRLLGIGENSVSGSLPSDVGNMKSLQTMDISSNKFSGEIPSTLGHCSSLEYLYMEDNFFQGTIPPLSALKAIQEIDFSRNNLSGPIPKYMEQFPFLHSLNLSFNNLEGEVPKGGIFQNASAISVLGNIELCGGNPKLLLPACPKQTPERGIAESLRVIIPTAIVGALCLGILLFFVATHFGLKKSKKQDPSTSLTGERFLEVTYQQLLKATDEFSSTNLIGGGSYGSVYKGELDNIQTVVAIKVLKLQHRRASKSFIAECKALRSIRHRNIVNILTVCSSIDFKGNDFMALVFEYMPNGNLDMWLHPNINCSDWRTSLNLIQRINIAIDVACALDHLHHQCHEPVVHCDLKPSNILLDNDLVAHVSDFGLARVLSGDVINHSQPSSSSLLIKGSIGYIAPEYGMSGGASTYGDVYSYGILLLEMVTGKRPTDDAFKDSSRLHQFAKMALPERVMEIADRQLLDEEIEDIRYNESYNSRMNSQIHLCLVSLVKIGVSCSEVLPKERPNMRDVVGEIQGVRDLYLGIGKYKNNQNEVR